MMALQTMGKFAQGRYRMRVRRLFTEALLACALIASSSAQAREKPCPPDQHEVTISFRGTSKLNPWGTPLYFGDFELSNQGARSIRIYTEFETDGQKKRYSTVHPLFVEVQRLDHDQWHNAMPDLTEYFAPGTMSIIHPGDTWDFHVQMDALVERPDAADQKYRLLVSDTSRCPYVSETFTIAKPH